MPQILDRSYSLQAAHTLMQAGLSPLLARIYAARGIMDTSQLRSETAHLLQFQKLKHSTLMAKFLADAIAQRKKLLVVADYDADGATACAVAVRGLRALGAQVDFIVPNRFEFGYGLTPEIVKLASRQSPDILITVDNGIASVDGVDEAKCLGIEVLVTDHHLPGESLPDALCIVNPNQSGCEFPSKNLAGVGVMFYVLLALRAELRERGAYTTVPEPNLASLLDLVALGTVADVVKLDDNNRILVHQGLQRIRANKACAGINALLQVARKSAIQATTYELGFIVGPRLNAAGRLEDMTLGIRCLLTDDPDEASQLARQLDELNRTRREIEADMQQTALASLEQAKPGENYTLSLFDVSWHQGVVGILASRLKEKFHRPVIAFARVQDNELKGSGRSIAGLHLRDALDLLSKRHPNLLLKFGGHAMAAGLSIREQHFQQFQEAFEDTVRGLLTPADLTCVIETDGVLEPGEFTLETAHALERQVWGQGFPQPLFMDDFTVLEQRIVGEKHLKLKLGSRAGSLDAMLFFFSESLPGRIRAVYSLKANEFNGNVGLQLVLSHWQPMET